MNRWALGRAVTWLLTALLFTSTIERVRVGTTATAVSPPPQRSEITATLAPIPTDSLNVLADRIVEADIFRLTRRPSPVAFGTAGEGGPPPTPTPPKPPLALAGVVGGPPWIGLLDGVPGRDQSVLVHAGDTVGGLRVRTVTRNRVVIAGFDTTWQLTVREPWH